MKDRQIKQIISQLTGVELVKTAMPLLKGQIPIKDRRLNWHAYKPGSALPDNLPQYMVNDLEKRVTSFSEAYMQFVSDANVEAFSSMVFIFWADDPSLKQEDFEFIRGADYLPEHEKQELLRVAKFITDKGVPLAMSPREFKPNEKPSWNGSPSYTKAYGWAWGAKEGPLTDPGNRFSRHVPEENLRDANWLKKNVDDKNQVLVQVVTAQMGGKWGIFFQDESGEILPVVPEKFLEVMRQSAGPGGDDENLDTKINILREGGGIDKFYGARGYNNPNAKGTFTPGSGRFYLQTPDDPRPRPVNWKHKNTTPLGDVYENRTQFTYRKQSPTNRRKYTTDPNVYKAMLRVNGTMYWQNEADSSIKIDMTEAQVDYLNHFKGKWFRLGEPGYRTYVFSQPEQQNRYQQDCESLNKLWDVLRDANRVNHAASQMYQTIIVGPRFTEAHQSGEKTVPGILAHPENVSEEPSEHRVSGDFTGKRDVWVVEKHEYPISEERNEQSKRGFFVPQNITGRGAIHDESAAGNVFSAISLAVRNYQLPQHVIPSQAALKAAQDTFNAAQSHFKNADNPAQEQQLALPAPAGGELAVVDNQNQQVNFEEQPTEVNNNQLQLPGPPAANNQNVQQVQVRRVQNPFGVQASDIIKRIKKLG